MQTSMDDARAFWREKLTEGGATTIPRWTLTPQPGTAVYEAAVAPDLLAAARQPGVLLTAHAKVLAALSGEPDITTGYAARDRILPCRPATGLRTWRDLIADARRAESELLAHQGYPVEELAGELGLTGPPYETVLDPGHGNTTQDEAVLRVAIADGVLRLRYRTDVLDAEAAARIAGYHLTALTLITADPDADHREQSLLCDGELRHQIDGLAGPRRELPDARAHELFEQRVRAHPDAVAIVHGELQWTYRELDSRANRIARALLARGLGREDVVAVVTERDPDWAAAVLAVFKAGGVYLPIEPHFPAGRIATTLSRAECGLVLTESGSTATLGQALAALPGVRTLLVEDAYAEGHADHVLDVTVTEDQLAYIYFTSGSTGEPKGAMCEHAGMLNHLFAKIDDLGIGPGQIVAQTAPQCFDISLWQLISALLVGGRTLLVEQDAILDVERFVDKIADGRVNVLQIVPSYLEVVLTYLERQPRELPDLRWVCVTGEALRKELTERWFACRPKIGLVNAYGLTETSDDTNHEVMNRVPERERVPLGPAVSNVRVYVVDERLTPVPLGAPGEIVFSGVCVGRGYINDSERTRAAFTTDPHRPGERLYRSGDHGRWLPEGKLEFLGRRDTQVKVRGFRIEIGEIENTLLRVPGVRDGAVVVAEQPGGGRQLVAFYTADRGEPVELGLLRERLSASLPAYMVPSAFHHRRSLPLTANSKTDRKALTALAAELDATTGDTCLEPRTATERRLAGAWAKVLGVPVEQIGRLDHFFDRGGSSLTAVKLAIALDRTVSLKDVTRHPVLGDLADLVDGRGERRAGLLQTLSKPDGTPVATLICFPYAGGNAVNFQPLARELRGSGIAVHAVELPGHDLTGESEPFAPLEQTVERVVDEIAQQGPNGLLLWGHSAGTAYAVETARQLEERGISVGRVFLAAQLPGDLAARRAGIERLMALGNTAIAAELSATGGYAELGELDTRRAEHAAAAYRFDCVTAHRYFAEALQAPPTRKLTAPVTVVVAADDPGVRDPEVRHGDWKLFADQVELRQLPEGGHHFTRTRPEEAARAVLRGLGGGKRCGAGVSSRTPTGAGVGVPPRARTGEGAVVPPRTPTGSGADVAPRTPTGQPADAAPRPTTGRGDTVGSRDAAGSGAVEGRTDARVTPPGTAVERRAAAKSHGVIPT